MKLGFIAMAGMAAASAASGQARPDVPAGSPLGTAPPGAAREQAPAEAQRARLQAAAAARANAQAMTDAFTTPAPMPTDAGRSTAARSSFDQTIGATGVATRPAPSPYGGYYQIRTPWDGR